MMARAALTEMCPAPVNRSRSALARRFQQRVADRRLDVDRLQALCDAIEVIAERNDLGRAVEEGWAIG